MLSPSLEQGTMRENQSDAKNLIACESLHRRGGLAPWQLRLVFTHVEANLTSVIATKDLAGLAKRSRHHFSRAFRDSVGQSPHAYVMRRRIEHAQALMLGTAHSLGRIAAECGLADQAHLNKAFRRAVGESPGCWRRMNLGRQPGEVSCHDWRV
jgi:AraC family transcriptional regulator